MLITIGLPCYDNPTEVWFTVQALRMYHDLSDCEILIVDNFGTKDTRRLAKKGHGIRYKKFTEVVGTAVPRNKVFEWAQGDFVLCLDSHVLLWPGAITQLKEWLTANWDDARNLIHGPIVMSNLVSCYLHYEPQWRAQMWGIWPKTTTNINRIGDSPWEITMHGCGLMGCRKDSWLGFNPRCRGFAGVEGVIHEKYRRAGRKVLCLPFLKWVHHFNPHGRTYPNNLEDRIRNFIIGFDEVGMDKAPLYEHFGYNVVESINKRLQDENNRVHTATQAG